MLLVRMFCTFHLSGYSEQMVHGIKTWLVSEIAAYCGGNAFLLKQKLHTHNFARKST